MSSPIPEQFCAGAAECLDCAHTWAAVWPLGCANLACPSCSSTDTLRAIGAGTNKPPTTH